MNGRQDQWSFFLVDLLVSGQVLIDRVESECGEEIGSGPIIGDDGIELV
jgi:hypothetical protein